MPLYNYKCWVCGHEMDSVRKFTDEVLCPKCRRDYMEKQLSSFNFRVKGFSEENGYSNQYKNR